VIYAQILELKKTAYFLDELKKASWRDMSGQIVWN